MARGPVTRFPPGPSRLVHLKVRPQTRAAAQCIQINAIDYVLTQKLCIGPPTGKLNNNAAVAVKSDTCNTEYTVKYL